MSNSKLGKHMESDSRIGNINSAFSFAIHDLIFLKCEWLKNFLGLDKMEMHRISFTIYTRFTK